MDKNLKAYASYSIRKADRARKFYQDVLGLTVKTIPMPNGCNFLEVDIGEERFVLYEKEDHVPATFTVMNLEVPDIGLAVKELRDKGIRFEHYKNSDDLGILREEGGPLIAWFRDPDGNFISVVEEESLARNFRPRSELDPGQLTS